MKERTFYTINLDLRRITILVSALILLVVYSFILGHTMGKKKAEKELAEEAEISLLRERDLKKTKEPPAIRENEPVKPETKIETEPVQEFAEEEIPETPELPVGKPIRKKKEKPASNVIPEKKQETEEPDFYTLQLGAFSTKEQASRYKDELLNNHKKIKRLSPYLMKNGELYTVRMGKGLSKEDMETEKNKLSPDIKKDVIIVRVKQN